MIAGILYAWMIVYYYGYGDPIGYKDRSDEVLNSITRDWANIKYIFLPVDAFRDYILSLGYSNSEYLRVNFAYYTDQNFMISRVSCLTAFFTFNRFLIISFVFTNIAYYGFILIYTACKRLIGGYKKELAISCLFIPSCIFWSSGLAKEPICIIALGVMFSSVVRLFFGNQWKLITLLQLLFFSYVLYIVKSYIFYCFSFSFVCWILYNSIKKLVARAVIIKIAFALLFTIAAAGIVYFLSTSFVSLISENIRDIISYNIDAYESMAFRQKGSLIEVKDVDISSFWGIIKFIPQGLVNVYFRPFPWEISNVLMIFTVLENLFFIYLFFRVLVKSRFFTRHLFINKNYQVFAVLFSFTLAFAIGISTFNFGSMVRYKMPFLPFWAGFLLIISRKLSSGNKRAADI